MNQFTKYTGTVSGTAGTLITALDAALVTGQSWTKIAGTNVGAYRAPSGGRLTLYVDDNGSGSHGYRDARVTGYETLASVGPVVGTNCFPLASQNPTGLNVNSLTARKSTTLDATARTYVIYADTRTVYMFVQTGDTAGRYMSWMFGEFYSLVAGDPWNTALIGRDADGSGATNYDALDVLYTVTGGTNITGHFLPRGYTGLPTTNGSLAFGKHGDLSKGGGVQVLAGGGVAYPNPTDGGLYLSPVWVHEPAGPTIRGRLRGFWQLCHLYSGFTDGETFTGTGDLAGRTFTVMRQSANNGAYCIETSATLETN